jgi:hypothetical protein
MHGPAAADQPSLAAAQAALAAQRYETARRLALAVEPADAGARMARALTLHDALARLGDLRAAMAALAEAGDGFEPALRRVEDLHRATTMAFYRTSPEQAEGLTYEEFQARLHAPRATAARALVDAVADQAQAGRARRALRAALADADRRAPGDAPALAELERRWPEPPPPPAPAPVAVRLAGRLRFAAGAPADALVTLGVEAVVERTHPTAVDPRGLEVEVVACGAIATLSAPLTADGTFAIVGEVPPGTGFLAVTVPGAAGVPTRYVARGLRVDGGALAPLDLPVEPWTSAPAPAPGEPLPGVIEHAGRRWTKHAEEVLANPFWHDFPRQDLRLDWPAPPAGSAALVWDGSGAVPHQVDREGRVLCFAALGQRAARRLGWYHATGVAPPQPPSPAIVLTVEAGGATAVLDTGVSRFRIPWGAAGDGAAPLLAVMGPDRAWRGQGRWQLDGAAAGGGLARVTTVVASGALECVVEVAYRFPGGQRCVFTLTVHAGEEYLLVEERGDAVPEAALVFGLDEFRGGRGYLHWCAEGEAPHWHGLDGGPRELARLQESVPWWIPPAGFGWAATFDGCDRRDLVAVFTRRRGDWVDHAFAAIAGGPPAGGHELDWPYPEMVGSTISMVTAVIAADGRPELRFPRFAGERHWGLLASDLARGDGPLKELHQVRHKTSFPRLDQLRRWTLDQPDRAPRPCLVVERERLPGIRAGLADPAIAALWRRVRAGGRHLDAEALAFAVAGDPATGWRLGRRLAALIPAQARCLLLSRENGDLWSPVGGRAWAPQAAAFDAVAASGALTPAEERELRAGLLLAGHLFMSPELMNWRYGARNANFESDRVDAVGSIGLCFPGDPDAEAMVAHAVERMRVALAAYCTPGSGKWYENPACYYLQALRCRMSIACLLAARGRLDLAAMPRLDGFLGWLLHMITPRLPASYAAMRDGCAHAEYAALTRVRRVAPIGDHAHLGPWIPDIAAVVARWLRAARPELAAALRWAWDEGGRDGGYHGSAPLLLAQARPADLAPDGAAIPPLPSRRLEGFGAVFRGAVGADDEFMLLAKLGPGGYRYHRSEGSFILVADGRPLVYDGGEGGEAWRHSGITYHEARLPPAPGRIERFASLPSVDYAQGLHPVVPRPGDPAYLSDVCDHRLVEEAHRRARIARPAAARAWLWVKGGYVLVWDRLDVDAEVVHRWNLQVLADAEAGDPYARAGLRFRGRFGTDLQVLLPGAEGRPWTVAELRMSEHHLPPERCVAQRHLEAAARGAADWLAVLRPLPPGAEPVAAAPLVALGRTVGARVTGAGLDDRLVAGRVPVAVEDDAWSFAGCAGGLLRRPDGLRLLLLGPGRVAAGGAVLESDGPAAELAIGPGAPALRRDGEGQVRATVAGLPLA